MYWLRDCVIEVTLRPRRQQRYVPMYHIGFPRTRCTPWDIKLFSPTSSEVTPPSSSSSFQPLFLRMYIPIIVCMWMMLPPPLPRSAHEINILICSDFPSPNPSIRSYQYFEKPGGAELQVLSSAKKSSGYEFLFFPPSFSCCWGAGRSSTS